MATSPRRVSKVALLSLFFLTATAITIDLTRPAGTTATGISGVAAGAAHTCALTNAGGVQCWGYNVLGQIGDATTTNKSRPVNVLGFGQGMSAIASGAIHSCSLDTNGNIKCWGYNEYGQLGDGTTVNRTSPVTVLAAAGGPALANVTGIAAGGYHTCAITTTTGVKCWGENVFGQLGDGTTADRLTPVDVVGLTGVVAIAAGFWHTCALTGAGTIKCWGDGQFGTLGDGLFNTESSVARDVCQQFDEETQACLVPFSGATSIAAGGRHNCAVTSSNALKCWGLNDEAQLGDGTTTDRATPTDVTGLGSGVTLVRAGGYHTCALLSSSTLKCWGHNYFGQLGDGTNINRTTPVDAVGLAAVATISLGGRHTCARLTTASLRCFGRNLEGQLGDLTLIDRYTAVNTNIDSDADGCTDAREQQTSPGSQTSGGLRTPKLFWDYFDTPDGNNLRDRAMSVGDTNRVVARFGQNDSNGSAPINRWSDPLKAPPPSGLPSPQSYHPAFDRSSPPPGGDPWDTQMPDGAIAIQDIAYVTNQFGHSCI